jgi:hypothetical protein
MTPPSSPPPEIGCLWIGEALSFLEELCLASMVRHGARVTVWAWDEVAGLPEGVALADAGTILPWDAELVHRKTGSPALMSDLFRYHLLKKRPGTIWCDTDVLFLKPLGAPGPYVFGYESETLVNGALAGLPADEPALDALLAFCEDRHPVLPWADEGARARLRERPVHVADLPWGTWGPAAFTWFLRQSGAIARAAPREVYHPVPFADVRDLIFRGRDTGRWITEDTRTVHLYGRATRRIVATRFGGVPPWHGFLGRTLRNYGIDARAPVPETAD